MEKPHSQRWKYKDALCISYFSSPDGCRFTTRTSVIMEARGTTGAVEPKLTKQTASPPHPDNNAERQQAKRAVRVKTMHSPG